MNKAEKDIAERIYPRYAITLTNPLTIDEFVPDGKFKYMDDLIYEHRRLDLDEQFLRIRINQSKSMDMSEPYDIGFANAMQLLTYIITGVLPEFIPKPASVNIVMVQLQDEIDKLNAKIKKLAQKLEKSQAELEQSQFDLKDNITAKELAIKALEVKHVRALAEAKKVVVNESEPKTKKKWSLGKK